MSEQEANVDPRQRGLNYGPGWGRPAKPAVYEQAQKLADRMRSAANDASQAAWRVDMALRDLRLAERPEEKVKAVAALQALVAEFDLSVASD